MRCRSIVFTGIAAALALGIGLPFRPTVVMGQSMSPTMHSGGVYVINTRYYHSHPVQNGDVVVFRYRGETCTKRVFAVPGQRLLVLRDDDGGADEIIDKSDVAAFQRLERGHRLAGSRLKELTVPPGCCYVLGDNREVSWDSRSFGWLPIGTIVGRVSL